MFAHFQVNPKNKRQLSTFLAGVFFFFFNKVFRYICLISRLSMNSILNLKVKPYPIGLYNILNCPKGCSFLFHIIELDLLKSVSSAILS